MHICDDSEDVYVDWKRDLYESIQNATRFIYLAIPSFNPNVILQLNETKNKKSATVGEMLHEKYGKGIAYSDVVSISKINIMRFWYPFEIPC